MTISTPTLAEIRDAAAACGLTLNDEDARSYQELMKPYVDGYNLVEELPDELPAVDVSRRSHVFPAAGENPENAWYVRTSIKTSENGKLAGKRIAIKDNIMVAGLPMMNGSSVLEGYVPEIDATVVTRVLEAGAEIVGKTHCEYYCLSGSSHTGAKGPVHNPYRHGYSAGGSSSGNGVALAKGEIDIAIGGDQGGSVRMPAAWCGIYGMKPTHGLVPYSGAMPIEIYIDHLGPMSRSVMDNALLLEVIAGEDGYDPRQFSPVITSYSENIDAGVNGMRIGILREGFGRPESEAEVDAQVRKAVAQFENMGATVEEVSVPMHLMGPSIWTPIGVEGIARTMMFGDGYGLSRRDLYVPSLMLKQREWRSRPEDLSETTKVLTVLGTHILDQFGPRHYGKAVNLSRRLKAAYDAALQQYDILVLPTLPMKPTPLPEVGAERQTIMNHAFEMTNNTCPFDISHHPAMSVPCGLVDGLPVGMMIVGRHFDEATVYRAAYAFEQTVDWKSL